MTAYWYILLLNNCNINFCRSNFHFVNIYTNKYLFTYLMYQIWPVLFKQGDLVLGHYQTESPKPKTQSAMEVSNWPTVTEPADVSYWKILSVSFPNWLSFFRVHARTDSLLSKCSCPTIDIIYLKDEVMNFHVCSHKAGSRTTECECNWPNGRTVLMHEEIQQT